MLKRVAYALTFPLELEPELTIPIYILGFECSAG